MSKAGVTEHEEVEGGGSETLGDLFQSLHQVTHFGVLGESCFFLLLLLLFLWSTVTQACSPEAALLYFTSTLASFASLQF